MNAGTQSRIVLLAAALATAAPTLAACAPAAPIHTKAPGGHHVSAPPSPTPTPTPTPTVAASPPSLVDTTCTEVASLSLVRQLLAENGVVATGFFKRVELQQDANFTNVALRQLGGLGCYWQGGPVDDSGPEAQLAIEIVPNASAMFASASTALESKDDVHNGLVKSEPKLGSASYSDCVTAGTTTGICTFDIEVGTYWLNIVEQPENFNGQTSYTSTVQTSFLSAVTAAVTSLAAPGASWPVPADAAKIPTTCAAILSATQVDSVLGPKIGPAESEFDPDDITFLTALRQATNVIGCNWSGPLVNSASTSVVVDALPGSGWAWSSTSPAPGAYGDQLSAIGGLGDAAFGDCDKVGAFCIVYAETDDSWFSVDYESSNATLANTETLARDILAAAS